MNPPSSQNSLDRMLETIFVILKFAGVIVSGIGGFISTLPETKTKKVEPKRGIRRAFTRSHGVQWAIAGLLVAFLSQFAETLKSNRDSRDAEKASAANRAAQTLILSNLALQTSRQQQSLSYVERLIAPLEPPRAAVQFRLTLNNPALDSLRTHLERTHGTPEQVQKRFNNPAAAKYLQRTNEPKLFQTVNPSPPGGQGIQLRVSGLSVEFADFDDPGPRVVFFPVHAESPDLPGLRPTTSLAKALPSLKIELFSKHAEWFPPSTNSWRHPDLLATTEPVPFAGGFYNRLTGEASLQMQMKASTNWQTGLWLNAVPDLADADCCVTPTSTNSELAQCFQPITVTLDFGRAAITLTNFQRYIDAEGNATYHAKLPSIEGIRLIPNFHDTRVWKSSTESGSVSP